MHIAYWIVPAAVIAACVIAWLAKRRADKRTTPDREDRTPAGPGDTGTGTGNPR